jgi:ABC-2 type transport system permease protein
MDSRRASLNRYRLASWAIAWRQLRVMVSNPAFLIPSILMPVFFFSAFAGGLSAVSQAPTFDYPDYSTFQYVFVLIQSAMFGGVFAGFAVAADFESGFSRRMMLATRSRSALIVGYALAAFVRAVIVWVIVTVLALATGASVSPSPGEVIGIILLITLVNIAALLFAAGMAMRMRTMQAAPLIQLPAFLIIFTAPVYVPRDLLEGWVGAVADFNPVTAVIEAGRELIIGAPAEMLLAFGAAAGLMTLTAVWAVTGLRRAERAAA